MLFHLFCGNVLWLCYSIPLPESARPGRAEEENGIRFIRQKTCSVAIFILGRSRFEIAPSEDTRRVSERARGSRLGNRKSCSPPTTILFSLCAMANPNNQLLRQFPAEIKSPTVRIWSLETNGSGNHKRANVCTHGNTIQEIDGYHSTYICMYSYEIAADVS